MNLPARSRTQLSLFATVLVFVTIYGLAAWRYDGFLSRGVFYNLLGDNAFLGLTAVGMTFVILLGGIDLSVGSMIGFTSIFVATLITKFHLHPLVAFALAEIAGVLFGAGMGALIQSFALPPFLVTLAGLFFARGLGFVLSLESITVDHPFYRAITGWQVFPATALIFLVVLVLAAFVSRFTRFGRAVYAVGGNEQSARLMGLPVGRVKVLTYTLSGFCSALAGIVYSLYTSSGNASVGVGTELDAIAAVVIGGTLLTGGVGSIVGTLFGVLILGAIQTMITFEGTLNSWYTRIAIGALLLVFILLQRFVHSRGTAVATTGAGAH